MTAHTRPECKHLPPLTFKIKNTGFLPVQNETLNASKRMVITLRAIASVITFRLLFRGLKTTINSKIIFPGRRSSGDKHPPLIQFQPENHLQVGHYGIQL